MKPRIYSRDKRSPNPKNEKVSKVMSANKGKNTKPELALRQYLWQKNLKGYRVNYNKIPGRPDIAFVSKKVAIFVNGCFWHRCPKCNYDLPKNNTEFWRNKFEANIIRDSAKIKQLEKNGWSVVVVWECDIKANLNGTYLSIKNKLDIKHDEY